MMTRQLFSLQTYYCVLQVRCSGNLRITSHADQEFQSNLTGFQHRCFNSTGIAGDTENHFVRVAGSDTWCHITGDIYSRCFHSGIGHYKTNCSRRSCHEAECLAWYGMKCFLQCGSCACGISEFQMTGFADIKLPCIFLCEFEAELDRMTYI